jgi:hypothetical protein
VRARRALSRRVDASDLDIVEGHGEARGVAPTRWASPVGRLGAASNTAPTRFGPPTVDLSRRRVERRSSLDRCTDLFALFSLGSK